MVTKVSSRNPIVAPVTLSSNPLILYCCPLLFFSLSILIYFSISLLLYFHSIFFTLHFSIFDSVSHGKLKCSLSFSLKAFSSLSSFLSLSLRKYFVMLGQTIFYSEEKYRESIRYHVCPFSLHIQVISLSINFCCFQIQSPQTTLLPPTHSPSQLFWSISKQLFLLLHFLSNFSLLRHIRMINWCKEQFSIM